MRLAPGTKLGPYEILAQIGAGGMGEVWKARDTRLGRIVAIKVLNKEHMQRFEREARAIAALNHPHICTLHDIGPDYLVMEYVDGVAIRGPLPVEEAVRLAIQIASALDEAHKNGILHRDLKPGNILITSSGTTKLLDFGLAKLSSGTESETASTIAGAVMGTPAYMSPEQAQGMLVDARSDIFSFGAVLYEIISGKRAFEGASTVQVLSAVMRDEPKPWKTQPQLERIVMRCLAKQPGQRFQTMAEVKAALEQISAKPTEQQPSIAVLPFVNMSGDKEQEYFSDGLAEEIINGLTQISGLKVIARTSAFAFRGKDQDIRRIAEALSVTHILEGSVRKAGNRIRVTAQLITASDGSHLWSERYDREMTDVFAIQDEISQAIARKLLVRLSAELTLVKRHTDNLEAYNLYLRGRYQLFQFTKEGLAKSKDYYQQAIATDPHYALPWSGLANYFHYLGYAGILAPKLANEQGKQAATKALYLNEALPDAHCMMGIFRASEFDWREAEHEFRRALELDSKAVEIRAFYAFFYLVPIRRLNEAAAELRQSVEQDPISLFLRITLGRIYLIMRQYDRAIEQFNNALEIVPNNGSALVFLGQIYLLMGLLDEGIHAIETAAKDVSNLPIYHGWRGQAYAHSGRFADAQKVLEELSTIAQNAYIPAINFAMIHLALGEMDRCFDCLNSAVDEGESSILHIYLAPFFDPLRSHPRYHALLRKMNLDNLPETPAL